MQARLTMSPAFCQVEPFGQPSDDAEEAVLNLRIPSWVVPHGSSVELSQGEVVARDGELEAGSYLSIRRRFQSGRPATLEVSNLLACVWDSEDTM